jgi:hypothetical protein
VDPQIPAREVEKDFYDLYFLLDLFSLDEILVLFKRKFSQEEIFHVIKSLTYFEDAEQYADPMVFDKMITWPLVKNRIIEEAQKIVNIDLKNNIANRWSGYYSQHPDEIFNFEVSKRIRILTGIGGKGMTSSAGYAQSNIAEWF